MEQTLKITNVLSDATRLSIYEYLAKKHNPVNVQEIADKFGIHPNVARLHLSKLENIGMIVGKMLKNPKGGRPFRVYELSDEVIKIQYPFRDYEMLAKIALETLFSLGELGKTALITTGKEFGKKIIKERFGNSDLHLLSIEEKLKLLNDTSTMLGLDPEFEYHDGDDTFIYKIFNCPFKELTATDEEHIVCEMHRYIIKGMFDELFSNKTTFVEQSNIMNGCKTCSYQVKIKS